MININKLTKSYGNGSTETCILKEISLNIEQGEMVALMGPSGSGKTTLLNIIGCLDVQSEGEYLLKDSPVNSLKKIQLARIRSLDIGFIFQQFALIPEFNALENVELPLIYSNRFRKVGEKLNNKQRKLRSKEVISQFGMLDHINKYPSQLSGGQQQRVAIARALVTDPDLIIADEPTGALDQRNGQEVLKILTDINNSGKTVLIVTHDQKVAECCKRKILISDGIITYDSKNLVI